MAATETDIATAHIEARIDVAVGTSVDIAIETDVETRVGMPRIEMPGNEMPGIEIPGIEMLGIKMLTRSPRSGARDGRAARNACPPLVRAQPSAPRAAGSPGLPRS